MQCGEVEGSLNVIVNQSQPDAISASVTPVPLPASAWLKLSGLGAFGAFASGVNLHLRNLVKQVLSTKGFSSRDL